MEEEPSDLHYRVLTLKVQECIADGNLEVMLSLLEKLPITSRNRIARQKLQGKSAFFMACELGKTEMVSYLIRECGAEFSERCTFDEYEYQVEAPPIWVAAYKGYIDVIRLLVASGFNVNETSSSGSTSLLVACQAEDFALVLYLCQNGADVNIPNDNGITCLRESIDNLEICELLLFHGANVNYRREGQYSILHCAIKHKNLDVVKLLLDAGADQNCQDFEENDALQYAAIQNCPAIVEYMISKQSFSKERVINTYELLGASHIDDDNYTDAFALFNKALKLRFENGDTILRKEYMEPKAIYLNLKEPQTAEELANFNRTPENMNILASLVRERILGVSHGETIYKILMNGVMLSYDQIYDRAFVVIKYAYTHYSLKYKPLHQMLEYSLSQLVRVMYDIYRDNILEDIDIRPRIPDMLEILGLLVTIIDRSNILRSEEPKYFRENNKTFENYLNLTLDIVYLICQIKLNYDLDSHFSREMQKIMFISPKNIMGESILHIALSRDIQQTRAVKLPGRQNWFPYLTEILLQHGADVNSRDIARNTPLHSFLKSTQYSLKNKRVIERLLQSGTHVDACDFEGKTVVALMREAGYDVCEVQHTSLKCLASRAVISYQIPLAFELPKYIVDFILLHGKTKYTRIADEPAKGFIVSCLDKAI